MEEPGRPGDPTGRSIFFGQHDRDDALSYGRVGRIGRVAGQVLIVVVDLEKDHVAVSFERAKVVLFMWVVGVTKVVEDGDGLDDLDRLCQAPIRGTGGRWPIQQRSATGRFLALKKTSRGVR
jgi:hypothetical protein